MKIESSRQTWIGRTNWLTLWLLELLTEPKTSGDFDIIGITGRFLFGHCSVRLSEFCDQKTFTVYIFDITASWDWTDLILISEPCPCHKPDADTGSCVFPISQTYWPLICYLDAKPIFSVWWPSGGKQALKHSRVLIYCNCKDFSSAHVVQSAQSKWTLYVGALW